MLPGVRGLQKPSCKEQYQGREGGGGPEDHGAITSMNGQGLADTCLRRGRATERNGGSWPTSPLQCPNGLIGNR